MSTPRIFLIREKMKLLRGIRRKIASARISDEILYAQALREYEDGIRRDGLWARALAQSNMQKDEALALYLKLRVQSLRDELAIMEVEPTSARLEQTKLPPAPAVQSATQQVYSPKTSLRKRQIVGGLMFVAAVILLVRGYNLPIGDEQGLTYVGAGVLAFVAAVVAIPIVMDFLFLLFALMFVVGGVVRLYQWMMGG